MNSYRRMFLKRHTFLPVIHAEYPAQAIRNAKIAFAEGADGIFLINHRISADTLLHCYDLVRNTFPSKWIGLNFLDLTPMESLGAMQPSMSGLWVDDLGVYEDERGATQADLLAKKHCELEKKWRTSFLLFGGVAFKYQAPVKDLAQVTKLAAPYVDVLTTSGSKTGSPPEVSKIRAMKNAAGDDSSFAIASGITAENVKEYMPYADCFLVATGISNSYSELDPKRVGQFAKAIL